MKNYFKTFSVIALLALAQIVFSASKPIISLSSSQPVMSGSSAPALAIGSSSPYAVSCVASDPTDPLATTGILLDVTNAPTSFTFSSGATSVVANADCKCELVSGTIYRLTIKPCGVGYATITIKAKNTAGTSSSFNVKVAASTASARPSSTIFPTVVADASAASPVDDDYMFIADDETNVIRLYNRHYSGQSVDSLDITVDAGGVSGEEFDMEASSLSVKDNAAKRIYWIGSLGNSKKGALKPYRNRVVATDITGTGANSKLAVKSYSENMRPALISWGDACGWNFTASAAEGMIPKRIDGFNIEGLAVAPQGEMAYVGFRAPCVPVKGTMPAASNRLYAVVAPVTNFEAMMNVSGKSDVSPVIGEPVLFDFGGLGIRSMERVGTAGYLIVAGLYQGGGTPAVYLWDGVVPANSGAAPIVSGSGITKLELDMSDLVQASSDGGVEGHPEALMAEQSGNVLTIHLICDNGTVDYYGDGTEAKSLIQPYKKFRMDTYTYILPGDATSIVAPATLKANFKLSNRKITAQNGNSLAVYDIGGKALAKNAKIVNLPAEGVYFVKCAGVTSKIVAK